MSFLRFFIFIAFHIALTACVSVNLGQKGAATKSEVVKLKAPASPFSSFKMDYVDQAWKNDRNGNSISYLSECQSVADPSLATIYKDLISSINRAESLNEQRLSFNGREALRSTVSGFVDGVKSQFELLVFKKNNCTYILSYVATEKNFNENISAFNSFVENFFVP